MSYEAQAWASRANVGQPTAKLVLLMLAYHHNGLTGQCNPSLTQLAEDTGLTQPSVSKALKTLRAGHWVFSLGRVHGQSNWYLLHPTSNTTLPLDPKASLLLSSLTVNVVLGDTKDSYVPTHKILLGDTKDSYDKQGKKEEIEKGKKEEVAAAGEVDTERVKVEASIFRRVEDFMGTLTATLSSKIGDAIDQYSAPWILDALSEAEDANVRKWNYIEAILKRWAQEGKSNGRGKPEPDNRDVSRYYDGYYGAILKQREEQGDNNVHPP